MTRNTKAEQVHLKDYLSVKLNFGSLTKIMIEKNNNRTRTQGPPGPPSSAGPNVIQYPIGSDGTQGERRFNGTQGNPGLNKIESACLYVVEGNLNSTSSDGVTPSLIYCDVCSRSCNIYCKFYYS